MASKLYGQFLSQALNKEIDWDTDTIKVALLTNAYTPNQDSHNYFDDVVANEVSGTGYTSGGYTLANKTNTYNSGTNVIVLDADDVTFASSTITAFAMPPISFNIINLPSAARSPSTIPRCW